MLFNKTATATIITVERSTTGRKYQESSQIASSVAGKSAVAPAGGCVVCVICITTMATAVDSDAASQRSELKRSWSGIRLNSFVMQMPTSALRKWPKMTERGCASGTSIAP